MRITPFDHGAFGVAVIEYLAGKGVVSMDTGAKVVGDGPPIFYGLLPDEPNRAVGVFNVTPQDNDTSAPTVTFMLAIRGEPHTPLGHNQDAQRLLDVLHLETKTQLTATHAILSCKRVQADPPLVPDSGGRYTRVDTYQARVLFPTTQH